jgi:ATP-dependent DNA helicase RecQ
LLVYGIGSKRIEQFGEALLRNIKDYCAEHQLPMDNEPAPVAAPAPVKNVTPGRALAIQLFKEGAAIDDVIHQTGRARATILDYLADFIRQEKPASIDTWIAKDVYERVAAAIAKHGCARLKPLFIELEEKVPYDEIRLVAAHLSKDP